jgi:hypothetical protein
MKLKSTSSSMYVMPLKCLFNAYNVYVMPVMSM